MGIELRIMLVLSSLMMFFFVIKKIKKARIRIDESIFWIISSLLFLLMALFPGVIISLADLMGVESPANLVFLLVVGIVFLRSFLTSINLSAQLEKQTQLVQHIAILEKRLNDKSNEELLAKE